MAIIINGDTQFTTNGNQILKTDLNQVYIDIQEVPGVGINPLLELRLRTYRTVSDEDYNIGSELTTVIDGIPKRIKVDATSKITEVGFPAFGMLEIHELARDYLENNTAAFNGKVRFWNPFGQDFFGDVNA
jgi:hypothetical protein